MPACSAGVRVIRGCLVFTTLILLLTTCTGLNDAPTPLAALTPHPTFTLTPEPPTPTATAVVAPEPTATSLPEPATGPGTVSGRSCYPSSQPPPLTLHLQNTTTAEEIMLDLAQGETDFSVEVPPGDYTAYAATVGTEVTGGYSQAAACGLAPECADHSLLPFTVSAGQTTAGIELCDWYEMPGVVAGSEGQVIVETLQKMNVHAGPSLNSPIIGDVPPRVTAAAVGQSADGTWLLVEHPQAGAVWIYAPLTKVRGQPESLPVIATEFDAAGTQAQRSQFTPAAWSTEANQSVVHFKGLMRDPTGEVVNGYSVLLYNGTWSVLSHPTGASHHYPDVADGAWDLIIHNASDAAGWWALTVVSYDCPDFETGFNAQCKQFTPLSATQIIPVVYPDENIVNADWLCQRDCDQGLYVEPFRRE